MTTAIALFLTTLGPKPHFAGTWPADFAKHGKPAASAPITAVSKKPQKQASTSAPAGPPYTALTSSIDAVGRHLTPEQAADANARGNALAAEVMPKLKAAKEALADLRPYDVVMILTTPGTLVQGIIDPDLVVDAYIRQGDTYDAYNLMASYLHQQGGYFRYDPDMLHLSLVAALSGEVYQGQREAILRGMPQNHVDWGYYPPGYDPQTIAFLSCLRLAGEASLQDDDPNRYFYGVMAYQMNPTNPLAGMGYGGLMTEMGHYHEAMRAYKGVEGQVKGTDISILRGHEQYAQWYIDHPNVKKPYDFHMRDPNPDLP